MKRTLTAAIAAGLFATPVVAEISSHTINRYAPLVKLHPREPSMPVSVETFLNNSVVKDAAGNIKASSAADFDYASARYDDYFDLDDSYRVGNPVHNNQVNAPVYVRVREYPERPYTDIQYIMLFPDNQCTYLRVNYWNAPTFSDHTRNVPVCNFGVHEGDWEHITVRVNDHNQQATGVFMSGHGGGDWYDYQHDSRLQKYGSHPVVYPAINSHASYSHPEVFVEADLGSGVAAAGRMVGSLFGSPIRWAKVVDVTTTQGTLAFNHYPNRSSYVNWSTWQDMQRVDGSEDWMQFSGHWGEPSDNSGRTSTPNMEGQAEDAVRALANLAINLGFVDKFINGSGPRTPAKQRFWNEEEGRFYPSTSAFGGRKGDDYDDRHRLPKNDQKLSLKK